MKTRPGLAALLAVLALAGCAAPQARNSASFYYPSSQPASRGVQGSAVPASASSGTGSGATVPRGGYAPGSGPTAMPPDGQFIGQYRETSPFGSYSSSTVIQSSGGVQSYQTIGNMPVYPGQAVPGYVPNQPYYGPRNTSQQPVFVPGTGGNPGYYINPTTGARVGP